MKKLLFFSFMLMLWCLSARAQDTLTMRKHFNPFVLGITDNIHSTVLSEKRLLNIYLPANYQSDTAHFPVIYLLDGSANEDFVHITGIVQFFTMLGIIPDCIIVGIANVDRKRDFTFPTTVEKDKKDFPTTGGSAKFMGFLEKELIPYIRKNYRTKKSTLIGQSLGGLLATEILLKKQELFDDYIIVSPSLWWDHGSLLKAAPELLAKQSSANGRIYIAVGTEGKQMENDAAKLAQTLKEPGVQQRKVDFVNFPDETHTTILHNAIYKALMMLYGK